MSPESRLVKARYYNVLISTGERFEPRTAWQGTAPLDTSMIEQLRLEQALRRACWVIAWEQLWPHFARALIIVGLFLAVSWAGTWLALPFAGRAIGIGLFVLLIVASLMPLWRLRWPTRADALRRLDRETGVRHRPTTALTDTLASADPVTLVLWQAQRERTLNSLKRIRAGLPSPRLAIHDPWALRALVFLLMAVTFVAADGVRVARVGAAFNWDSMLLSQNVRIDAWVMPPSYTARPPIILLAAGKAASTSTDRDMLLVPTGSTLMVHASGGRLDVAISGGVADAPASEDAPKVATERSFIIIGDGRAHVRMPSGQPQWTFKALPDAAPKIALVKDPEHQARGSLLLTYKIEDDYGVADAHAQFTMRNTTALPVRPLFDLPQFALVLPHMRTRNGIGQTIKDLSEHPYAGTDVTLTLIVRDEAGNEGRSEPLDMHLPRRHFAKPLSRALIELRRMLALDANQNAQVHAALEAILAVPETYTPEPGQYLGLSSVTRQLERARTDDALREVIASLWALAVMIEDIHITDVEKVLRAAQDAMKQALEQGASNEEIKRLAEQLRSALDNYMRQLAEQLKNNPQQLTRSLDSGARVVRRQDLTDLIERMERLSRAGDKDAAKQLFNQLQKMLENLQIASPAQGDGEMEQTLNELGDVIRKQQQLRDKTFKQSQDSRRDRLRGQQGHQNTMSDLLQDQQTLHNRLQKSLHDLNKDDMGSGPGDDLGLNEADSAMNDAADRLSEGNADGAVDSQGQALEALRKGVQKLSQDMQQQVNGGSGSRVGRSVGSSQDSDPLGRPLRSRQHADDFSVKIPGEIEVQRVRQILEELRRRVADPQRPQLELDYIERLLKDY